VILSFSVLGEDHSKIWIDLAVGIISQVFQEYLSLAEGHLDDLEE
jgi:hypothetical protein